MSELTLAGNEWKPATWAFEKGLFAKLLQPEELDTELEKFATQLASYNLLQRFRFCESERKRHC